MTTKETSRQPGSSSDADIDDVDAYIATLTDDERSRLAAARTALDLAALLYDARRRRGLSQADAAKRTGFQQQAISRFERGGAPQWDTLQRYLLALGYSLEFNLVDVATGETTSHALRAPNAAAD